MEPGVANGDQRRQGVADHGQANGSEPGTGQDRQLERQRQHPGPGFFPHASAQGRHHEDRDGECLVLAVAGDHRLGHLIRAQRTDGIANPHLAQADDFDRRLLAGDTEGRPAEQRGGQITAGHWRVAPAAICILVGSDPANTGPDEAFVRRGIHQRERHHGGRCGERTAGQLALPVPVLLHLREQAGTSVSDGLIQTIHEGLVNKACN